MGEVLSAAEITRMMKELLVAFRSATNTRGAMIVEPSLRHGSLGDSDSTFCTHDFSDPTTWYQRSIKHELSVPTTTDNFNYQLEFFPILNADSHKLYGRDLGMPMPNASLTNRNNLRLQVKVNEQNVLPNDVNFSWTINYNTGLITFKDRIPNEASVTVDYHSIPLNTDPYASKFVLKAPPGKIVVVEHVEVQFSDTVEINDDIIFELWAAIEEEQTMAYGIPQYINSPLNPWRQVYRCAHDFINNGNEGQGSIPAFGGATRGISKNTIVFPFNYIQAFSIESKYFSELHVYLGANKPYTNSDIATCAFYTSIQEQQD